MIDKYINARCIQDCKMELVNGNLYRYYKNSELFDYECLIYMQLIDAKISPLVNPGIKKISYHIKNMQSFRSYISNSSTKNIPFIINDVFNFILSYKSLKFVHGNLHIDNLFIYKKKFYILDFVNAYHYLVPLPKSYKRSSFLGEFHLKETSNMLEYWDMFTFYLSLKSLLTDNVEKIDKYFFSYIPLPIFKQLSLLYEYNNISCSQSYLNL